MKPIISRTPLINILNLLVKMMKRESKHPRCIASSLNSLKMIILASSKIKGTFLSNLKNKLLSILVIPWLTMHNKSKLWRLRKLKASFLSTRRRFLISWLFGWSRRLRISFLFSMPGPLKGCKMSQRFCWTTRIYKSKCIHQGWLKMKLSLWKRNKKKLDKNYLKNWLIKAKVNKNKA